MKKLAILFVSLSILLSLNQCADRNQGEDLVITPSGYEMVWHERGEGDKAEAGDYLFFSVAYSIDDSILFDTRMRPDTPSIQLPPIEDEETIDDPVFNAFRLMVPGDSVTISQRGDQMEMDQFELGENTLDFHITLYEIMAEEEHNQKMAESQEKRMKEMAKLMEREEEVQAFSKDVLQQYKDNALGDDLIETESGLKYVIHEKGSGAPIQQGESATVHYYGLIIDSGEMFDNSFQRGEPFALNVGAGMVIPGWDEALLLLNRGAKASVFIPYDLAYGMEGRPPVIPEQSDLMFYMEVQE